MGDEVFLILAGFVHPHPKRKAHIHTLHPGANELSRNDAPEPAVRAVARVMETAGSAGQSQIWRSHRQIMQTSASSVFSKHW